MKQSLSRTGGKREEESRDQRTNGSGILHAHGNAFRRPVGDGEKKARRERKNEYKGEYSESILHNPDIFSLYFVVQYAFFFCYYSISFAESQ